MGLVQATIPGLYNGISQQPPTLRLENQAEIQENALSLLADGLLKRPNTEFVKRLTGAIEVDKDSLIHFIDRDKNERYIVIITKDKTDPLRIYTLAGEPCSVTYKGASKEYLTSPSIDNPHLDFKCVSIADHTFVVNKKVSPAVLYEEGTPRGEYPNSGVFFIQRGFIETDYSVTVIVNNIEYTADYSVPLPAEDKAGNTMANTENIAEELATLLESKVPNDVHISREGSCIFVRGSDHTTQFGMKAKDSYGNQAITVVKGTVQKFTDLPPIALNGTRVTIAGEDGSTRGNFYVKYKSLEGGQGYWEESYKLGVPRALYSKTMPHKLVRISHNKFSFEEIDWKERIVGDEESAPMPSFVGKTISDIFFFKNRFGILSSDNVILSEAGEYYNFFPNTVTDVLDGDPIDISVLSSNVVSLKYAVPMTSSLLLFSGSQQFILSGAGILSPVTVTVDHNAYHNASTSCSPKAVGPSVFFVSPKGAYSSLREYYIQPDITSNDAEDVTAHVPQYLPNSIKRIEANIPTNTLFVLPYGVNTSDLFVYSYYWEGDQKVQSSWGKWIFPGREILGVTLVDNWLYIISKDSTGSLLIEKMNLEQRATSEPLDYRIHLDLLVKLKGVYDSSLDVTRWTLPYSIASKDFRIVDSTTGLEFNTPSREGHYNVLVSGDHSAVWCFVGVPYVFKYRFSQWYLRDDYGVAIIEGRLQIRNLKLSYVDTGYFKVRVLNGKRENSAEYTGATIGPGLRLGKQNITTGEKRFYIGGSAETVVIEIVSDSYMPSRFQVASYEGYYTRRI